MPRSLIGTPVTDKKHIHDLVLREWEPRYSRGSYALAAGTYEIGEVIVDATAGASAVGASPTEGDVLCLENVTVPDGETWEVPCLARGPALVNLDEVVRASDAETDDQLIIRLADLIAQGVRFVREPVVQSTSDLNG